MSNPGHPSADREHMVEPIEAKSEAKHSGAVDAALRCFNLGRCASIRVALVWPKEYGEAHDHRTRISMFQQEDVEPGLRHHGVSCLFFLHALVWVCLEDRRV